MDKRDDSSEVLLQMNGVHAENNNMGEKPFHRLTVTLDRTEKPVKKVPKLCQTRNIVIVSAIAGAALLISVTVILILHIKATKAEVPGPSTNATNSSSSFSSSTSSPTVFTTSSTKKSTILTTKLTSRSTTSSSTSTSPTTTTPTTTTTTLPPCPIPGQFQCSNGRCINMSYVCDGKPHCPLAEDESSNCSCSEGQFRCASGQCIPSSSRCDGSTQCFDRSDEMHCADCAGFECDSGLCLWTMSVRCNGRVQCPDLSDEKNCPYRPGYLQCNNDVQLPDSNWCNGKDDCYDNSDETDCGLTGECLNTGRLPCSDGKTCFVHTWKCDGFQDCPGGGDEAQCRTCSGDQYQCPDYSCLDKSQVCDGQIDCPSGADEVDCMQLTQEGEISPLNGVITAISHDRKLPVCSDNWDSTSKIADEICEYLGNGPSVGTDFISLSTSDLTGTKDFVVLDPATKTLMEKQSVLARFTKTSECSSKEVVSVTCKLKACGERQMEITSPMIVGGVISPPGKWPWMVSLSMLGRSVCGGVIVNQRWVLTAAHCIVTDTTNYTLTPHFFEVTVGTNSRTRTSTDTAQRIKVDKILIHPNATRLINTVLDWDLALLHLKEPVKFGDKVQPVCLPTSVDRFPTKSQCYLAGWGYINQDQVTVQDLREAKMTLWLDSECGDINYNSTICAGYHSGSISACQGDSGGPLMCKNAHDRWTVIGIMSNGPDSCNGGIKRQASKFAEILSSMDWIYSYVIR